MSQSIESVAETLAGLVADAVGEAAPKPFNLYSLPPVGECLIYALTLRGRLVYVGKTTNLLGRLAYHGYNGLEFDGAMYRAVPAELGAKAEREAIRALRPRSNRQHCKPIRTRRARTTPVPGHDRAWITRNGRYWKLTWAQDGGRRSRSLGAREGVSRAEAVALAVRALAVPNFGHDGRKDSGNRAEPKVSTEPT